MFYLNPVVFAVAAVFMKLGGGGLDFACSLLYNILVPRVGYVESVGETTFRLDRIEKVKNCYYCSRVSYSVWNVYERCVVASTARRASSRVVSLMLVFLYFSGYCTYRTDVCFCFKQQQHTHHPKPSGRSLHFVLFAFFTFGRSQS